MFIAVRKFFAEILALREVLAENKIKTKQTNAKLRTMQT